MALAELLDMLVLVDRAERGDGNARGLERQARAARGIGGEEIPQVLAAHADRVRLERIRDRHLSVLSDALSGEGA